MIFQNFINFHSILTVFLLLTDLTDQLKFFISNFLINVFIHKEPSACLLPWLPIHNRSSLPDALPLLHHKHKPSNHIHKPHQRLPIRPQPIPDRTQLNIQPVRQNLNQANHSQH